MEEALSSAGLRLDDIAFIIATGYGRINVPFADKQVTEISCHAKGVRHPNPGRRTVIDVGGQDCKGIKLNSKGRMIDFVMNDKCAAKHRTIPGTYGGYAGYQAEGIGKLSLTAKNEAVISSTCTVFAEQEVITRLAEGVPMADLVAGIHKSIAYRIIGLVNRIKIEPEVILTGGGAKNIGLVKALETKLGMPVKIPPDPFSPEPSVPLS